MEVYGTIVTKVKIEPVKVLKELRDKEYNIMKDSVYTEDGKYFIDREGYTNHVEISKERYEYIRALNIVINHLLPTKEEFYERPEKKTNDV